MSRKFTKIISSKYPKNILYKYLYTEYNKAYFIINLFEDNKLNNAIYNNNYDLAKELIKEGEIPDLYSLPLVNMESDHFKDFIYLLTSVPNDSNILTQYSIENSLDALIYIEDPTLLNNYLQSIIKIYNKNIPGFLKYRGYNHNDYKWVDEYIKLIKDKLQNDEGNIDELNIMLKLFYSFRFRFCNSYESCKQLIADLQSLGIKTINKKPLPNIDDRFDENIKNLGVETVQDLCSLLESDLDFKVDYYNDNVDFSLIKPAVIKNYDDYDDDQ
jgi:hypothetical protein